MEQAGIMFANYSVSFELLHSFRRLLNQVESEVVARQNIIYFMLVGARLRLVSSGTGACLIRHLKLPSKFAIKQA